MPAFMQRPSHRRFGDDVNTSVDLGLGFTMPGLDSSSLNPSGNATVLQPDLSSTTTPDPSQVSAPASSNTLSSIFGTIAGILPAVTSAITGHPATTGTVAATPAKSNTMLYLALGGIGLLLVGGFLVKRRRKNPRRRRHARRR